MVYLWSHRQVVSLFLGVWATSDALHSADRMFLNLFWGIFFVIIYLALDLDSIMADKKIPLSNDPADRARSDKLDKVMGWAGYDDPKESKVRAAIHAAYHEKEYHKTGNPREHERAKDQWGVVTGGSRDNVAKYDAKHFPDTSKK